MREKLKKLGYEAPKMEATSFVTEKGYAGSGGGGRSAGTQGLSGDILITFGA